MALHMNQEAYTKAQELISQGKINADGDWSFDSDDQNALLEAVDNDWDEFAKWFLVYDDEHDKETFARYAYPYGKQGEIWRRGVIAVKSRAAQQDYTALVERADNLLEAIDEELEDNRSSEALERRYVPLERVETRAGENGEMYIEGYPIVYDSYAPLWGFREVIRQGAATEALKDADEIVLWNHDPAAPMARRSNGTLEVKETEQGVWIRADVSKTRWGRDGYESIQNGVTTKMSFAFSVDRDGEQWNVEEVEGVEIETREIVKFSAIYDYSPVSYPAYEDTSVLARSKERALRNRPQRGTPAAGDTEASVQRRIRYRERQIQIQEAQNA